MTTMSRVVKELTQMVGSTVAGFGRSGGFLARHAA